MTRHPYTRQERHRQIVALRPSLRCRDCDVARKKTWTQQAILDAIRLWAREHDGVPPSAAEWLGGTRQEHDIRFPYCSVVQREFGSWANAIEAAGFPRPHRGRYRDESRRRALGNSNSFGTDTCDRIVAAVAAGNDRYADIVRAIGRRHVSNQIKKLVDAGTLARVERGRYEVAA